jgi:hypothetical protein
MAESTKGVNTLFEGADKRDLASAERYAKELLTQIGYLRKNGPGDEIRWGLIAENAWLAWRVAAKADRRHAKRNGWFEFRWRLPKGYAA